MQKEACNLKFFEKHLAWSEVQKICINLNQNGFEAYLAGGCVRDLVMSVQPKDFDIATNATPDQILALYPKALSVGREFGVIILAFESFQIEIASFRKDGPYLDGRRPSKVEFVTANEDALRRDFTINALFIDFKTSTIIDYVGGMSDIDAHIIRAVGDPYLRFAEDKLRMLRALRFSSQLNFKVDSETLRAIEREHKSIGLVSNERIKDELTKWFQSANLKPCLDGLWSTQLLQSLHPTFERFFKQKNYDDASLFFANDLRELQLLSKLCLFFSFIIEKNQTDEFECLKQTLKDLKFSQEQIGAVHWTLTNYFKLLGFDNMRLSDQIEMCAHYSFNILEEFTRIFNESLSKALEPKLSQMKREFLPLPAAFIDGEDLKGLGYKPGREMGEKLREIYRLQVEKKLRSKAEAIEAARSSFAGSR